MAMSKAKTVEIIPPKNIWDGNKDAAVSLVLYGDYESIECGKANDVINEIRALYPEQIRFQFRHFPLTKVNQHAHKAAEASVAAAQEGKFIEMHNLLFANRRNLGTISLKEYAREAGVTSKNFLTDLVNSVYGWQVRNDLLEALHKGVREVPAIYINDEKFTGRITLNEIKKVIDPLMRSASRKVGAVKKRA
jgi:protein-disulfide isomerase